MRPNTKFLNPEFLINGFGDSYSTELKAKDINNLAWNTADTVDYSLELSNIIRRKRAIHIVEHYP